MMNITNISQMETTQGKFNETTSVSALTLAQRRRIVNRNYYQRSKEKNKTVANTRGTSVTGSEETNPLDEGSSQPTTNIINISPMETTQGKINETTLMRGILLPLFDEVVNQESTTLGEGRSQPMTGITNISQENFSENTHVSALMLAQRRQVYNRNYYQRSKKKNKSVANSQGTNLMGGALIVAQSKFTIETIINEGRRITEVLLIHKEQTSWGCTDSCSKVKWSNLDIKVTELLDGVLSINPYVRTFRSLAELGPLDNYRVTLNTSVELDQRLYNQLTTSKVAAIWVEGNDNITAYKRSIVVYGRSDYSKKIEHFYGCYDPLAYRLFFPNGESGWHARIPRHRVCIDEILMKILKSIENVILLGGRLFQQFVVDMYIKIETTCLSFIERNQAKIRSDLYQGVVDCVNVGKVQPNRIGQRVVLPASFIGGPCDMRRRYMDAMALVQDDGKPDIFLTMTSNSYPTYQRRQNGIEVNIRGNILDNRWVVPYNLKLLMMFNCHINVEVCSSIIFVKYLFKYVYKGHDKQVIHVDPDREEVVVNNLKRFQDARYVSSLEAIWRIFSFKLSQTHPCVMDLQVHLSNKQLVKFRENDILTDIIDKERE
ncbi:hypothetical protein OSB04_002997 [Centaurea solstitialis]|uniref:Helitron helicase-like domain-containing protein n=1 Tax=Centaurea solstitialis TaxID=347529 RepID=A0AA38U6J2_9ASTR|nr:hypothetical protein OSB04_002997 [Centaurea solstitialis]